MTAQQATKKELIFIVKNHGKTPSEFVLLGSENRYKNNFDNPDGISITLIHSSMTYVMFLKEIEDFNGAIHIVALLSDQRRVFEFSITDKPSGHTQSLCQEAGLFGDSGKTPIDIAIQPNLLLKPAGWKIQPGEEIKIGIEHRRLNL